MKKTGSFGAIQDRLRQHIAATAATSKAASAKGAAIPTDQIIEKETGVTLPTSDPEVKDILPSAGKPAEPKGDLTDTGVASGESMPGVTLSPPTEEKNRKEVSPETKLATINPEVAAIQNRLGETLKKAAEMLKAGGEVTSLGEKQENPNGSLGNSATADTSGATPTITNVSGVTQTDPGGSPSAPSSQGPGEKSPDAKLAGVSVKLGSDGSVKVTGVEGVETSAPKIKTEKASIEQQSVKLASADGKEINTDELSEKIAMYSQDVMAGRAIAHQMVNFLQDMARPEFQDRAKLAETIQHETMISTVQALVDSGLEAGIISQKQAHDLMELSGFQPNPLFVAIANVQEKIAALDASELTLEQKIAFVEKCANPEEAMAAAGGQPPMDPGQMQGAIGELLAQLEAAVASGQITEEQALQILQEQGVPVEQILGSAGGDPAAGADPTISADPSIAGDPASIAPPTPSPAGAPEAPSAPSAPKSNDSPEKKEDGEKKEKKEDDDEDDDDKEDKEKEASRSNLESKLASFITSTRQKKAGNALETASPVNVHMGDMPPAPVIDVPTPEAPKMKATPSMEAAIAASVPDTLKGPANTDLVPIPNVATANPEAVPAVSSPPSGPKYPDVLGVGGMAPDALLAYSMGDPNKSRGTPAGTPAAPSGMFARLSAALKDPTILTSLVAGGGLAAGGIAAHQMMKGDEEEEKKRKLKHAEIDPAMAAAAGGGDPAMMAAGGDPAMMAAGGGDPVAGGAPPSIEEILAEIEAALQSGAITPEQAEEIIQILSAEMGGGGEPQPDPAAGAAPVM